MTETNYHPHQTRLERVMGALNALPRFVLRLPFQTPMSWRLVLLTYTGRKSGRSYTVPVSYVEQGDTLLIPGGGAWKRNLEQGSSVGLRLRGSERSARPEVIKEIDEVERLVAFMMAANPAVSRFIGVPRDVDGRPNRERLEQAVRGGFAVVRLRLDDTNKE
jgi:deazaflavin-dependent oxidoreductase (nitroreductase family)